jgi:hypothetical protein
MNRRLVLSTMWLLMALSSIACAIFRYLGGPPIPYTLCYAVLAGCGLAAIGALMFGPRSDERASSSLYVTGLAPVGLLFVDLPGEDRAMCLIAVAVAALGGWWPLWVRMPNVR